MNLEHGSRSGSGKHSESHPEVINGTGSSDHGDTYPRLHVWLGSSGHPQIDPEKIEGSERSRNSELHSEVINGSDSSKHIEPKPESTVIEGDPYIPNIKFGFSSSSSSSSSSSGSSLYDLFDVIPEESADPRAGSADFESSNKSHEATQPASKDHENGVSIDSSHRSEENEDGSSDHALTPTVSDVTCESLAHNMSPKQSPPLQVMERPGGYDPLRIPSSIFEKNKGTPPMDWSVASNESLFSIHVGNNSFSRDHVLLLGDLGKSGDITKSGELIMFSPLPPREMVATDNQSSVPDVESNKQKGGANGIADNTIKDPAEYQNEENKTNQAVSWKSPSTSNNSYGSGDSVKSFSFPICLEERNMHGHCATVLTLAGRSATIGTVVENVGVFGKCDEKWFPESRCGAAEAAASGVIACPSLLNMQMLSMSIVLGVTTWKEGAEAMSLLTLEAWCGCDDILRCNV
ncbi:hypothetical protein POTOM_038313 [Populus tomentosa]|uniref:Uncharacterized protein n=1 Tax=Populus tomentosa TaxID=118781 RepID=A0A8X7YZ31_POPTO|nr:hypothetical protein POTOM_038313 [Populus tomentosa]